MNIQHYTECIVGGGRDSVTEVTCAPQSVLPRFKHTGSPFLIGCTRTFCAFCILCDGSTLSVISISQIFTCKG
jgi:hypothetical protein